MDARTRPPGGHASLYPPIAPHESGMLAVGDGHEIYWEVCGNPNGKPALFLHGGPGGGCYADHRRLFDPAAYRIVLFDQRGCGRSRPTNALEANTTQHILADMERLREMLGIDKWLILGGSWGATLALLYAQQHRAHVSGLVLRGVFTARRGEVDWLYKFGASRLFPEAWTKFIEPIPPAERFDLVRAYHRRLNAGERDDRVFFARAWCAWEGALMTLAPRPNYDPGHGESTLALARIETHYFVNDSFIREGEILANAHLLRGLPGFIVQGRYDVVTPATTSHELHALWPDSRIDIVPDAGHATNEPGTAAKLVEATDFFR